MGGQPPHLLFPGRQDGDPDAGTVRFDFADSGDRELPLILGLMPVLPKHAINIATFEKSTLAKPIGSGPYVFAAVDVGKSITFNRDPNYWGRKLPVNRGLWNFDELRYDFYRDSNAYFEAFKAGLYDVHGESDPTRWETGYDFPALRDGRIVKETFPSGLPKFVPILSSIHGGRCSAISHAPGDRFVARFPIGQSRFHFYISTGAVRAISTIQSCPPIIVRRTNKSARCSRPIPMRYAPTCSTAPGRLHERWLRPRPRDPAPGARHARRRRLRIQRHQAAQSNDRRAARFRNHGDEP